MTHIRTIECLNTTYQETQYFFKMNKKNVAEKNLYLIILCSIICNCIYLNNIVKVQLSNTIFQTTKKNKNDSINKSEAYQN